MDSYLPRQIANQIARLAAIVVKIIIISHSLSKISTPQRLKTATIGSPDSNNLTRNTALTDVSSCISC